MKHKLLLLISLLLGSTAFAQQETKKEPVSRRANNTLGVCMMGKTMQCNGISMSYIASEQGKIGFAFGAEYDREYMLGATPLGLVTGIRMEYSRPYAKFEEDGQTLEVKAHDLTGVLPVMLQYHDKLGVHTELQLFTGPSLDLVLFRKTDASGVMSGSGSYVVEFRHRNPIQRHCLQDFVGIRPIEPFRQGLYGTVYGISFANQSPSYGNDNV